MGVTKTENFTAAQNELATLAKALGHPARIAILEHLLFQHLMAFCCRIFLVRQIEIAGLAGF